MRAASILLLLLVVGPAGRPAALGWSSKLLHMSCDNRAVRADAAGDPALKRRPGSADVLTATDMRVTRPMGGHGTLALGICNGEVSVLASPDAEKLTVAVHLGHRLKGEETPVNYLQEFAVGASSADVEFKLPRSAEAKFEIYVPKHTSLELQMGDVQLEVKGMRSDIHINQGKGVARLYVPQGKDGFGRIHIENDMGSFRDLRTPGNARADRSREKEITGEGPYAAQIRMGMGTIELAPE